MDSLDRFEEPPWLAAVATTISYGLVLLVLFVLLFVVPFLLVS
ncbi:MULTISPECIES: hypothetical protein [Halomicrobium]|uniref:Uncharacterized protein n=1 Tax=Halomicrobium mukohataei (strain ATCC 700874 / DSM 12286 / JCM 9738 / NCIMB 13541) TaxID=485914 RepID=C7P0Z3_HALMD|nr:MULTISPECIES: hypothetical protein [Halomicrobium]ACV49008.1 conserved hypothetical protein [Halomicrobium mukohataei DSM 12286]